MKKKAWILFFLLLFVAASFSGCGDRAEESRTQPTTMDDLKTARIGILTGSIYDMYIVNEMPEASYLYFSTLSDQTTALMSGTLDAFAADRFLAQSLHAENDALSFLDSGLGAVNVAFPFPKTEDGKALCSQMNEFMAAMKADGRMAQLQEKWLSDGAADFAVDTTGLTGERTLVVGTSCGGKPTAYYYNGEPSGYELEIVALFCREYGYGLDIQLTDFSSVIPGIAAGKYDFGADGFAVTEERSQQVYFSDPSCTSPIGLVYKEISAQSATLDDLKTARIGILTGSIYDMYIVNEMPEASYLYFSTLSDQTTALMSGTLDAFAADRFLAQSLHAENDALSFLDSGFGAVEIAFPFPKTEDGKALCSQMNEFMAAMKADGRMAQLQEKWLSDGAADFAVDTTGLTGERTLVVGTSCGGKPTAYFYNSEPSGYEIELVALFCREYGYGLDIQLTDFSSVIPGISSGKYDFGADGFAVTEERSQQVYFSDPSCSSSIGLIYDNNAGTNSELSFGERVSMSFEKTFIRENRWKLIVQGIGTTVYISLFAAFFGTILGFGLCMLRKMHRPVSFAVTTAFIRILQGTPLVVLLMVLYYLVFPQSGLTGEWVAIIAFSMNFAAYVSEMLRTGIEAVDIGQTEAALALGFPKGKAFFRFILPQAAQHFLPVYKGELISLVKMTSIVGYIAVQDLTKMSDIIRSRTYEAFFPLISTAILYFLISGVLNLFLRFIEIKTEPNRKNRKVKGVIMQ